jgi:hypothetical protein
VATIPHDAIKLFPEIAKWPAEPLLNLYSHGIGLPEESRAVSTPTIVPAAALLLMVRLLMVIAIVSLGAPGKI